MKHSLKDYPGDPIVAISIQHNLAMTTGSYKPDRRPRPLRTEDFKDLIQSVKEGVRK